MSLEHPEVPNHHLADVPRNLVSPNHSKPSSTTAVRHILGRQGWAVGDLELEHHAVEAIKRQSQPLRMIKNDVLC